MDALLEPIQDVLEGQIVRRRHTPRFSTNHLTRLQDFEGQRVTEWLSNFFLVATSVRLPFLVLFSDIDGF